MIEGPDGVVAFGFVPAYERAGFYSLEDIHSNLGRTDVEFDGHVVPVISDRYRLFASSQTCVRCGRVGTIYAKERSAKFRRATQTYSPTTSTWHFNMYAVEGGRLILMTKDHIVPKARGGANFISNYQTMCSPCNVKKGHRLEDETSSSWQEAEASRKARIEKAAAERAKEGAAERARLKELGMICG